jgi:hypothetical protein
MSQVTRGPGGDGRPLRECDNTPDATFPSAGLRCLGRGPGRRRALKPRHDRHLLFGLLALQTGIINQGQLVAAFQAWTLDKLKSLADHLVARGDLTRAKRSVLEALAAVHLESHGGDVEQSLAAVPTNRATRAGLAGLGEPDIETTLDRIARDQNGQATEPDDDDPNRTAGLSVGSSTSDGQRFRILRPHARGGLGAVFVALDTELNREVAVKQILEKHAADPLSRQRFVAEAEITVGLEHPGVVPVYGLGTQVDGRPYYAMLAEDLERWMADEPVTAWREPFSRRARRWARRNRTAVASLVASVLVALAGTAAVLAVQTRANGQLKQANSDLAIASDLVTKANADFKSANEREKQRFNLTMDAIKLFHGEVSEDLLLKEKQFEGLRTKLLKGAADFYGRLEDLLKDQTDRESRAALGKAYDELGELTGKIGDQRAALAVHRKALAVRRALASEPGADAESKLDVARSLNTAGSLQR